MNDEVALEWLIKVFLPSTRPKDNKETRLLIFDGHGSYQTTEFMWQCYLANVYLLYLPPHTSHVLQPLDCAVFSLLKQAYRRYTGYLNYLMDSSLIGKRNFMIYYGKAWTDALTVSNI